MSLLTPKLNSIIPSSKSSFHAAHSQFQVSVLLYRRKNVSYCVRFLSVFSRTELSLLTRQGPVKMISFFFRLWHPSAFHLFKSNLLDTYWSGLSDFSISTRTGSRSIISQIFGRWKFFRRINSEKNSIIGLFERQRLYIFSESCLNNRLDNAINFELIDGTPLSWRACFNIYCQFFSASFRQKSGCIFSKQIWHSPLPIAFLNFDAHCLQTHSWDPFTYCLTSSTRS